MLTDFFYGRASDVIAFAFSVPSYLPAVLLFAALIVAGVVSYRLWSEMTEVIEPATSSEVLAELEQAYAEGEMDEAEFRRVRQLLGIMSKPTRKAFPKADSASPENNELASRLRDAQRRNGELNDSGV